MAKKRYKFCFAPLTRLFALNEDNQLILSDYVLSVHATHKIFSFNNNVLHQIAKNGVNL